MTTLPTMMAMASMMAATAISGRLSRRRVIAGNHVAEVVHHVFER